MIKNFTVFIAMVCAHFCIAQHDHSQCSHVHTCGLQPIYELVDEFTPPPAGFEYGGERDVVISVTYNGFSTEAMNAFQYAVDIWASSLTSNVPITIDAYWTTLGDGVLGSAGPTAFFSNFSGALESGVNYPSALANKLAGFDLNPGVHDIEANFNSDFSWYFGTDGNPNFDQFDFVSVVLHELGHGLGFVGAGDVNGSTGSYDFFGEPMSYDIFVETNTGMDITDFTNNSVSLGNALQGGNLFWFGANAVSANGSSNPEIYAPSEWESGSSYSHWDEYYYGAGNTNSLMTPFIGFAEAIHDPGDVTLGMMEDMGWGATSNNGGNCIAENLILTQDECADVGEGELPVIGLFFEIGGDCFVENLSWSVSGGDYTTGNLPDNGLDVFDGDDIVLVNTTPNATYDIFYELSDGTISSIYTFNNGNCDVIGGDCVYGPTNVFINGCQGDIDAMAYQFNYDGDCLVSEICAFSTFDDQEFCFDMTGNNLSSGDQWGITGLTPGTWNFTYSLDDGTTSPIGTLTINTCIEIFGCTNEYAVNYDPNADTNDGTCFYNETICDCAGTEHTIGVLSWLGDTFADSGDFEWDEQPVNFNCSTWGYDCGDILGSPSADPFNVCGGGLPPDNGCGGDGCLGTEITVNITSDCWPSEIGWSIVNDAGATIMAVAEGTYDFDGLDPYIINELICLENDCYTFEITDAYGDGLAGNGIADCLINGFYTVTDENGNVLAEIGANPNYGSGASHDFCLDGGGIEGCTDFTACNYNPLATIENGSCDYSCLGCTNIEACNYDAEATIDNGSCDFSCYGCTTPNACNYNPDATIEDGSCDFSCLGCIDPFACNFDPDATINNGSCDYSCQGCTDPNACNYDDEATVNNGSCDYSCFGCTDIEACNYDPDATFDNGSCDFNCYGCTDIAACNYDFEATINNGSCDYSCYGCTDEEALNYDEDATIDDGSCQYVPIFGCTDEGACNYDDEANTDDDSCEYITCAGCTDEGACNFDPEALILDDSCDYETCAGCTDEGACNFDPEALIFDDSCEYETCAGCMDEEAINYDPNATIDDDSCIYDCDYPVIEYTTICDSEITTDAFFIEMEISDLGNGSPYLISNNQDGDEINLSFNGTIELGPFDNNESVVITIQSQTLEGCFLTSPVLSDDCFVSVEELSLVDFEIYPNPSFGEFTIKGENLDQNSVLTCYDLSGRIIFTEKIIPSNNETFTLSKSGLLSNGNYLIEINSNGQVIQKNLVVIK